MKVLRTYSVEEKVISIIIAGVVIFLLAQSLLDLLHLGAEMKLNL